MPYILESHIVQLKEGMKVDYRQSEIKHQLFNVQIQTVRSRAYVSQGSRLQIYSYQVSSDSS